MAQAKLDMDFMNDIFSQQGKKTILNDPFRKNRLDKAVKALEQHDIVQGICARADFLSYFNDDENAQELLVQSIERYGYNELFASSLFNILRKGRWDQNKNEIRKYLSFSTEPNKIIIHNYFHKCCSYLDFDNDFFDLVQKYDAKNFQQWKKEISKQNETIHYLNDRDCSLETYRKVISIASYVIHQEYILDWKNVIRINDEEVQVIFSSEVWSDEDARELTEKINQAILAVDDVDFQVEADEISVFCINFDPDKLPDDFVYFDDKVEDKKESDELFQVVQSRMAEAEETKLTIEDCELLDV